MFFDGMTFNEIPPGANTVVVSSPTIGPALASYPITVAAGPPGTLTIELSGYMGQIRGTYLVNGAPSGDGVACGIGEGSGCGQIGADGVFRKLVPAGPGSGAIRNVTTFNYTAVAGQMVDVGTFSRQIGGLKVNLTYKGQPATQAGDFYFNVMGSTFGTGMFFDSITFTNIAPGSYSVTVQNPGNGAILGAYPVAISAGPPSSLDIELCPFAGVIRGTVTGATGLVACGVGDSLGCGSIPPTGVFTKLVPAGPGTGGIRGSNGPLWFFNYNSTACATTDIGNPSALSVLGSISSKAGPANARVWTYRVQNLGATPVRLDATRFQLTQTSGVACAPHVVSAVPVSLGVIAVNGSAQAPFTIDFTGCAGAARFRLDVTVTDAASPTAMPSISNQFQ
jgi:hypothetical protein